MTEKAKKTAPLGEVEIAGKKIRLFETQDVLPVENELPEGVTCATAVQLKFETPGQALFGQYLGSTRNTSNYKPGEMYCFHEIRKDNGTVVGFCGSAQLDKTLDKIPAGKYNIHIVYGGEKGMPNGQKFKVFHIFTRLRPVPKPRRSGPDYDEFGNLLDEDGNPVDNYKDFTGGENINPMMGEIQ